MSVCACTLVSDLVCVMMIYCHLRGLICVGMYTHAWLVMCGKGCSIKILVKYPWLFTQDFRLWPRWVAVLIIHREFYMPNGKLLCFCGPIHLHSDSFTLWCKGTEGFVGVMGVNDIFWRCNSPSLLFFIQTQIQMCMHMACVHTAQIFEQLNWRAWKNVLSLSECRHSIRHIHPRIYLSKLHVSCYLWWDSGELCNLSSFPLIIAVMRIKALKLAVYTRSPGGLLHPYS